MKETDPMDMFIQTTHDKFGNVSKVTTYDGVGNITEVNDPIDAAGFTYDELYRLMENQSKKIMTYWAI